MTRRNWKLKAVLITGSRDWANPEAVADALAKARPDVVIHGDCPTGADSYAAECADAWTPIPMPAQWDEHDKAAGPIRNGHMVAVLKSLQACGYDCEVHAFPIGRSAGTRDCMRRAERAGFTVVNHGDTP
jgi:hypothetical protein